MAVDKAIDSTEFDSKLTTVADAIRTAEGTTATMSFPTGMVDAISSLSSKGGGTEELSALLKLFGCSDYEISVVQDDASSPTRRINIPITNENLKSSLRLILIQAEDLLFPVNTVNKARPSTCYMFGFFAYVWPNIPFENMQYNSIVTALMDARMEAYRYHTVGNSFIPYGTSFLLENDTLTICFDQLEISSQNEFDFRYIMGTKVLLMGGNVQ